MRPYPNLRSALALAVAGVALLAGGALPAGASLCPGRAAAADCPMTAALLGAAHCHPAPALTAADCCMVGSAPAAGTESAVSVAPAPALPLDLPAGAVPDAFPAAPGDFHRAPEFPPPDGLYTLHRALLI